MVSLKMLRKIAQTHYCQEEKSMNENKKIASECLRVSLETINLELFKEPRKDRKQEQVRQIILEALFEAQSKPEYAKPFKIVIPENDWRDTTILDIVVIAPKIGDHLSNWVEQCLEWAQKITNGISWEELCNTPDTSKWRRLVFWKNGYWRIIGGATVTTISFSASDVISYFFSLRYSVSNTAPAVTVYD